MAFGDNSEGQLQVSEHDESNKVVQAAAGWKHTVLVMENGTVRTFGCNEHGQSTAPRLDGRQVVQACAGGYHTVLVLDDGTVKVFGLYSDRQLNMPNLTGRKVTRAAAGLFHTVLILDTDTDAKPPS